MHSNINVLQKRNNEIQKYKQESEGMSIDVEYRINDTEEGIFLLYEDENTVITIQLDCFDAHLLQKRLKRAIDLFELSNK